MKTAPTLPAMTDEQIGSCVALADRYAAEYRRTHWNTHLARAIIAARDAQWAAREQSLRARILELEEAHEHGAGVIENLHSVMVAAAEEIHEHWQAHCDEEGYGPANLMHRLEKGIPAQYAYKAGDFERLAKERDAAVARIDAAVRDERAKHIVNLDVHEFEAADLLRRFVANVRPKRGRIFWAILKEASGLGSTCAAALAVWAGLDAETGAIRARTKD